MYFGQEANVSVSVFMSIMQRFESDSESDGRMLSDSRSTSTLRVTESYPQNLSKDESIQIMAWDGPSDPRNPVNWSSWKKWGVMGTACFMYEIPHFLAPLRRSCLSRHDKHHVSL